MPAFDVRQDLRVRRSAAGRRIPDVGNGRCLHSVIRLPPRHATSRLSKMTESRRFPKTLPVKLPLRANVGGGMETTQES